jgi:hypothetical protein
MTDDPAQALERLRQRLAAEGLPKLSPEALRAAKLDRQARWHAPGKGIDTALKLSEEALRLYQQKSEVQWLWRKS